MQGAADKWRTESPDLVEAMRSVVDPLALASPWNLTPSPTPPRLQPLVALVGHRSAGKSRLLPLLCQWTGLPGFDLDQVISQRAGKSISEMFAESPAAFRQAERAAFQSLPGPAIVATGGGFLSLHADLLREHTAVLVPITFETYRARLLGDQTRPRLRPELTIEEELAQTYAERERQHAAALTLPLLDFLRHTAPSH